MLARFIASNEAGYNFREFRYLQSRVLLNCQDQLRAMERQLFLMDEYDKKERPLLLQSREFDDERFGERAKLLDRIQEKLEKYSTITLLLIVLSPMIMNSTLLTHFLPSVVDDHLVSTGKPRQADRL